MDILIALIPALGWGIMPILASKMGGKPSNQIVGTSTGAFIFALCTLFWIRPDMTALMFILAALSGSAWVVGQIGQFQGFQKLGVSKTMPISTGLQLVGTSLIGVLIFGEWPETQSKIIGFVALGFVIAGVLLVSLKSDDKAEGDNKAIIFLIFTTIGFLTYNAIPKALLDGGKAIFFPQACGMLLGALAYVIFTKRAEVLKQKVTWKNILPGLAFATAAFTYVISAQKNGIATAFVLAQLSVVISTTLGIVILKEEKKGKALIYTIIGLILVAGGSMATAAL